MTNYTKNKERICNNCGVPLFKHGDKQLMVCAAYHYLESTTPYRFKGVNE